MFVDSSCVSSSAHRNPFPTTNPSGIIHILNPPVSRDHRANAQRIAEERFESEGR